jgi:hypothetical protein
MHTVQKHKKKILYLGALIFGLFLSVFSIQKDTTHKYTTKNLSVPKAEADVPYIQSGYFYSQSSYGSDSDSDSDSDGDGDADGSDEMS